MLSPAKARARRAALGLGAAAAVALCSAPAAFADFSLAACTGEGIFGRGASFQNAAIGGFVTTFRSAVPNGCGAAAPAVLYDPAGSGAGRRALGVKDATLNPNQDRDASARFAGTDEPPTATERQQMETGPIDANGQDVTAADDGKVHVIPVAIGANSVIVRLPDGCDYSGATLFRDRPTIDNVTLEGVLAGTVTTWGAAITGLSAPCAAAPITRAVRLDSSGTTFALKQLLANINPTRGWAALGNTQWPNNSGATAVIRPATNGNGPVRDLVNATAGTIGYGDLATVRGGTGQPFTHDGATDTRFWLSLQRQATATYDDPQAAADGYKTSVSTAPGAPRGANCASATISGVPADSYGDWSQVDSTYTPTGYGGCTLTYDLAFDDNSTVYCNSAAEERKARTLKDYLTLGVVSDAAQTSLLTTDYDGLPPAILTKARAAVASIGWKKATGGRPCTAPSPPAGGGGGGGGGGGTTPPPPVSNVFTIASARSAGSSLRLSLQLPGAGQLVVNGSAKPAAAKAIKLARKTVTVGAAGTQRVTVALNAKAKKALKRKRKLRVTLTITYTPTGGTAKTVTRRVTVKAGGSSRR